MPNKCQKKYVHAANKHNINIKKKIKTDKTKNKMQKFKLLTGNNHLNQQTCDS